MPCRLLSLRALLNIRPVSLRAKERGRERKEGREERGERGKKKGRGGREGGERGKGRGKKGREGGKGKRK